MFEKDGNYEAAEKMRMLHNMLWRVETSSLQPGILKFYNNT